jgi:hypothetical protein
MGRSIYMYNTHWLVVFNRSAGTYRLLVPKSYRYSSMETGGIYHRNIMEPFAYLSVLTSIVLALGITRLLSGIGRLLQNRHQVRIYWVHLLWTLNVFLFLVLNWWILFRWSSQHEWSFFLFLFVLLSPTVAYLLTVLLMPDPFEDGLDLKHHFLDNHRWFFTLAALLPIIDAMDTLLKGWEHFMAQGPLYIITILLLFALNVAAIRIHRERFHAFFAIFFLVYILAFIAINLRVLG